MSPPDPAGDRYRQTATITRRVLEGIQRIWLGMAASRIEDDLEGDAGRRILELVVAGQLLAASGAQRYVAECVDAAGQVARAALALLRPQGFAGVASDGRPLASLLYVPALTVSSRRAAGVDDDEAMLAGLYQATRIASTQIADADRSSVQVAMAANPRTVMYARVVHLPACARCIILAGRTYSYSTGFLRHPNCDCTIAPVTDEQWREMPTPMDLFRQLPQEQQNRVFTVAGAQALREGADIGQVVNARRGMDTPDAATTLEGTTVRGYYGRRVRAAGGDIERGVGPYSVVTRPRLTPEGVFARTADRDEQIRLLRENAYLT